MVWLSGCLAVARIFVGGKEPLRARGGHPRAEETKHRRVARPARPAAGQANVSMIGVDRRLSEDDFITMADDRILPLFRHQHGRKSSVDSSL